MWKKIYNKEKGSWLDRYQRGIITNTVGRLLLAVIVLLIVVLIQTADNVIKVGGITEWLRQLLK